MENTDFFLLQMLFFVYGVTIASTHPPRITAPAVVDGLSPKRNKHVVTTIPECPEQRQHHLQIVVFGYDVERRISHERHRRRRRRGAPQRVAVVQVDASPNGQRDVATSRHATGTGSSRPASDAGAPNDRRRCVACVDATGRLIPVDFRRQPIDADATTSAGQRAKDVADGLTMRGLTADDVTFSAHSSVVRRRFPSVGRTHALAQPARRDEWRKLEAFNARRQPCSVRSVDRLAVSRRAVPP